MRRTPANHYATPSTVTCHGQSLQRQTGVVPRVAPCSACCCSLYVLHAWSPSYLIAISRATVVPSSSSRAGPQLHHSLTHSLTQTVAVAVAQSIHPVPPPPPRVCVCVCVELWHCCCAWHLTALTDEQRAVQLHVVRVNVTKSLHAFDLRGGGGVDPHWLRITITPTLVTENFGLVVRLPPPPGPSRCSNTNITST